MACRYVTVLRNPFDVISSKMAGAGLESRRGVGKDKDSDMMLSLVEIQCGYVRCRDCQGVGWGQVDCCAA